MNWEMYRNPTSGVSEDVWERFTRNKPSVDAGDVIYVRRGSYRVGTVAMASPRDAKIVMTRELLTLRVNAGNGYGITPYYLLALLSSQTVQEQTAPLTFIDTTMPNIGDRWRLLRLPLHIDPDERDEMAGVVQRAIQQKWSAQDDIDGLRIAIGEIVT